jgi:hypothetical protein
VSYEGLEGFFFFEYYLEILRDEARKVRGRLEEEKSLK